MKKYIMILAIVAIVVVIAVAVVNKNSTNQEVETKTIYVNEVTRSVFYAPQYVAISKGFFEKEGIKIDLTTGGGADKVMTAVLARSK